MDLDYYPAAIKYDTPMLEAKIQALPAEHLKNSAKQTQKLLEDIKIKREQAVASKNTNNNSTNSNRNTRKASQTAQDVRSSYKDSGPPF